jgi:hypothetical protein
VIAFEARVVRGEYRLNPEALEIQAFRPEAIPWHGIAFKTTHWALRDWVRRRRPRHPPRRAPLGRLTALLRVRVGSPAEAADAGGQH